MSRLPPTRGALIGQLTATSAHMNLAGDGRALALVGSQDGWLYAIDACAATMAYAVNLNAPVGAIAFADSDGDGRDEIVAATSDGFIYGLRDAPVAAPDSVIDLDPETGEGDVDTTRFRDRMTGQWSAVADADAYEITIVRSSDLTIVTEPKWQNVGNVNRATVAGLELDPSDAYLFVVRSVKAGEPSPDAASDGIVYVEQTEVGGDPSGGCGCGADPASSIPWWLVLLALAATRCRARGARHAPQ